LPDIARWNQLGNGCRFGGCLCLPQNAICGVGGPPLRPGPAQFFPWHVLTKKPPAAAEILRKFAGRQTAFSALAKRPERSPARRFDAAFKGERVAVYPAGPDITSDKASLRKNAAFFGVLESGSVIPVIVAEQRRPADKLEKLAAEKDRDGPGRAAFRRAKVFQPRDLGGREELP
jgi:hypothetical protein